MFIQTLTALAIVMKMLKNLFSTRASQWNKMFVWERGKKALGEFILFDILSRYVNLRYISSARLAYLAH